MEPRIGDSYKCTELLSGDADAGVRVGDVFEVTSLTGGGMRVMHNGSERYMSSGQMEFVRAASRGTRPGIVVHDEYSGLGLMARIRAKRATRN